MLQLDGIHLTLDGFTLRADLSVARSARLAVLGPSGGGKTTLLNVIAGFLRPDAGRVLIDGRDVTGWPVPERPLSMLFQEGNLFPHLGAFDNVALGIAPNLRLGDAGREAVTQALAQVGLGGFGDRRPGDLSGGQRSRVAIARMLLRRKPLALLDEPFAALDPGLRREMLALLDELCRAQGLTLVMVSHDLRDAERLCTDLCLLEDGAISLNGPLAPMLAAPPAALTPWL
ncbi:ATP-binding cassette domain-containing protein [Rhodobacteraceae bacterium W635]|uniref:thiamine ABC transporter ATP-binding protein n=1 Tax=Nioella halotolerans TaxID=2303578 RepID=UPI000E3E04C4|nr:ATP-binding cassette domain-containing protein [Rhodobacteraceae bacterium W635]